MNTTDADRIADRWLSGQPVYRADLERFARWAGRRGMAVWADLDTAGVIDYLGSRRAEGAAEASVARGLVSLRMLLRFLVMEGALQGDPEARAEEV